MEDNKGVGLTAAQYGWVVASHGLVTTNVQIVRLRITGEHSVISIGQAWKRVVDGQSALRATFHRGDDGFTQRTGALRYVRKFMVMSDLRKVAGRERRLRALVVEQLAQPLDLDRLAPWRVVLARFGDRQWELVVIVARAVFDPASATILVGDVARALGGRAPEVDCELWQLGASDAERRPTPDEAAFWRVQGEQRRPLGPSWTGPSRLRHGNVSPIAASAVTALGGLAELLHTDLTTVLGAVVAAAGWAAFEQRDLAVGHAVSRRDAEPGPGSNRPTIGAVEDRVPVVVPIRTGGLSFVQLVVSLRDRRRLAQAFALPSPLVAELMDKPTSHDIGFTLARPAEALRLPIGASGTVTLVPWDLRPEVVLRSSVTRPAVECVLATVPEWGGALGGTVDALEDRVRGDELALFCRSIHRLATAAARQPERTVKALLR